jgi:hypothetical protein
VADGRVEISWHGDEIAAQLAGATPRGLRLAGEHLLQVSRTEVPIEEATLERSGVVSVDETKGQAAVSYDTSYAVRQHEDMTFRHQGGRKAKYLEGPMNAERETMLALIAAAARRGLD